MAYIRLIDPAIEDLKAILRLDPSVLRMVLTKMLLLELSTEAGEPLIGDLVKWRKLTVGDRHWRIIWIPKEDTAGEQVIEVAQVWAVGARTDAEIYAEMKQRVESSPASPKTTALTDVLELLGDKVADIPATPEPVDVPAPAWLLRRIEYSVGLSPEQMRGLSSEQAMEIWEEYMRRPK
ncbi:MAG: hypothetical protein AABY37_06560 [Actinomycetota bacterium]